MRSSLVHVADRLSDSNSLLLNEYGTLASLVLRSRLAPSASCVAQVSFIVRRPSSCAVASCDVSRCVAVGPSAVLSKSMRLRLSQALADTRLRWSSACQRAPSEAVTYWLPSRSEFAPGANGPGITRSTSMAEIASVVPAPSAPPMRIAPASAPPETCPVTVRPSPASSNAVAPLSIPRRVKICTTPPMADEPYRLDRLPRTISMWSMVSSATPPSAAAPLVPAFRRTPSTSTSTCDDAAPRRNSDAAVPRPPACATCTPASRPSAASRSVCCQ